MNSQDQTETVTCCFCLSDLRSVCDRWDGAERSEVIIMIRFVNERRVSLVNTQQLLLSVRRRTRSSLASEGGRFLQKQLKFDRLLVLMCNLRERGGGAGGFLCFYQPITGRPASWEVSWIPPRLFESAGHVRTLECFWGCLWGRTLVSVSDWTGQETNRTRS